MKGSVESKLVFYLVFWIGCYRELGYSGVYYGGR